MPAGALGGTGASMFCEEATASMTIQNKKIEDEMWTVLYKIIAEAHLAEANPEAMFSLQY